MIFMLLALCPGQRINDIKSDINEARPQPSCDYFSPHYLRYLIKRLSR
ncbi:hypothetical protein HMPREF0201_01415 [Cedecea davisae DSM 4568]|uniref:Uncharacterized protein n=1 Tax=Cedecea davisae DSM 4568 TaxID=566551 RepID=S3IZS7_9ENTR|nr:hypothetical protein HMPREF0201_01415 [Cedecea davisae DSM 4568]